MPDFLLLFLTIPSITAVIGWITNWAAVKMIFYPTEFVGLGPIGWQGILTRRAPKFAHGVADMVTENLLSAEEIAKRVSPEVIEELLAGRLAADIRPLLTEAGEVIRPGAWAQVPSPVQDVIVAQVGHKARELMGKVFIKAEATVAEAFDLKRHIVSSLTGENVSVMVRLTKYIGRTEFRYIEMYGGVFGLIIGGLQVGLWNLFERGWVMPVVGMIVGLVTNWLAIQMIFRPQQPVRFFGMITYQGLFPKRQAQIAADYGRIAANEILTPERLLTSIADGPAGAEIAHLARKAVSDFVDQQWAEVRGIVPVKLSQDQLDEIKCLIMARLESLFPELRPRVERYIERSLNVGRLIESRMAALPKDKFERVLRGIFEEDETTLILVGGALGFGAGLLQAMLVLATQ